MFTVHLFRCFILNSLDSCWLLVSSVLFWSGTFRSIEACFCFVPSRMVRGQRVYLGWLCTSFRRARLVAYEDTLSEAGDCIRLMLNFSLGGTALWWLENSRWSLYMRHVPSLMRLPGVWTLRILAAGLSYF